MLIIIVIVIYIYIYTYITAQDDLPHDARRHPWPVRTPFAIAFKNHLSDFGGNAMSDACLRVVRIIIGDGNS